jgi:uncharacterized RDD family membrane protein YckC
MGFRLVAFVVDFFVFALPIMYVHKKWGWPNTEMQALGLIALSFFLLLGAFEWRFGSTPGKFLVHLRVVNASGQYPGFLRAVIRRCLLTVDLLFGGLVGLIALAVSRRAQRVGDLLTSTYVRMKVRKWPTGTRAS